MSKIRIGLMLGGGGAKGTYQLGVIRALEEAKILGQVKSISGTSIGAINTMLLMSKKNHKHIRQIWEEIDSENVFGTKDSIFQKEARMYSLKPLADTLMSKIDNRQIKKSKYKGFATAAVMYSKTSMIHQLITDTMEKKVFYLNEMEEPYLGVLASASIPVIFGPTKIDGFNYVDGGLLDNYPVEPLINDKCNILLTVALDNKFNPFLYDNLNLNIIDFTSEMAFEKGLKDYQDMLKFNQGFKDEKEKLGYMVGNMMVKKLKEQGYLKKFLGFNIWKKKEGFSTIKLSAEEEELVKESKLSTRKENKIRRQNIKKGE